MPVGRGKPRLFHRATEWKKGMEDFFHGQLGEPSAFSAGDVVEKGDGGLFPQPVRSCRRR